MNKGVILGFSALIIILLISEIMYNNAKIKKQANGSLANNNSENRIIRNNRNCEFITRQLTALAIQIKDLDYKINSGTYSGSSLLLLQQEITSLVQQYNNLYIQYQVCLGIL